MHNMGFLNGLVKLEGLVLSLYSVLVPIWHFHRSSFFPSYGPYYPDGEASYYHIPILQRLLQR